MSRYILALDQGTSSSRAVLFDRAGQVAGIAQQELRQIFPQPGWVEHCPREIWKSQLTVMRRVLAEQGVAAAEIGAIGIANQRETALLWDRATGQPLTNAIVWQDRRTAAHCEALRAQGLQELVRARTGLELDAYFSGTKLAWMLEHLPGARRRAERGELAFGTIDSWLVYKLSGAHLTDHGNASRTMLYNLHTRAWDPDLLAMLDIPAPLLPRIVESSGIVALASPELLGCAVPVAGIAGDQQAATFGQACHQPGSAKITYGTGSFLMMNVGAAPLPSANRLLATMGWSRQGKPTYLMEGSVFMAGATLQWLRDGLGIVSHIDQVEALANSVSDTGGVMLVPAFSGLGAPHWNPSARGALLGLTRGSGKGHIARAALEGIACQNVDVLAAMEADAGMRLAQLRVDGGGARSDLLMQLQADMLGVPVARPFNTESTALGAAQLAGLGIGFWGGLDELAGHWQLERCFEPAMSADQRQQQLALWRAAVARA